MQNLLRVKAAYDEIDDLIQEKIGAAVSANDRAAEEAWEKRKELNDYSFFVVLFAQFERIAKEKFRQARDARVASADWGRRRGWDGPTFASPRVAFQDQLAAVLDRQANEYSRIIQYYQDRNHVAHGGLSNQIASIDVLAADLHTIATMLRA
jgi:hypothetical protein